eukprot:81521-Pleurochrysis_carterae.AAC.1
MAARDRCCQSSARKCSRRTPARICTAKGPNAPADGGRMDDPPSKHAMQSDPAPLRAECDARSSSAVKAR